MLLQKPLNEGFPDANGPRAPVIRSRPPKDDPEVVKGGAKLRRLEPTPLHLFSHEKNSRSISLGRRASALPQGCERHELHEGCITAARPSISKVIPRFAP